MTKVGEHVTFDIIGTQKEYDPKFYEKLVYKIAKKAKVVVLEISKYKFEPQGFTLVALLAESHICFHTFPEKGFFSFGNQKLVIKHCPGHAPHHLTRKVLSQV